jgi:hypothetical protein
MIKNPETAQKDLSTPVSDTPDHKGSSLTIHPQNDLAIKSD